MQENNIIDNSHGVSEKQGYKHTKLGWIPEDWNIDKIVALGSFKKGRGVSKSEIQDEGFQAVRYGELYTDYNIRFSETVSFISKQSAENSREIEKGDILFTCSGEDRIDIGKAVVFLGEKETYAGGDLAIFTPKSINNSYISYYMNSSFAIRQKMGLAQGYSVVHIYPQQLNQVEVLIPSPREQENIISCLTTWDTAITELSTLINAKQKLKKGLMQQLLTGKKRLPGFDGVWEEKRLSKYIEYSPRQVNKPKTSFIKLGIRSHGKGTFQNKDFEPKAIAIDTLYQVKEDDLIVNITFAWEGAIALVTSEDNDALVSHRFPTYTFKEDIGNPSFFKQYIKTKKFRFLLELISPGGAGRNRVMSKKDFLKLKITIPVYEEQTAIAQILSTADKEIYLLQEQLEQLEQQKKGIMQLLLTGKKRLKD